MANKIEEIVQELNLDLKVAYIDGDDLIPRFEELKKANEPLANMEKGSSLHMGGGKGKKGAAGTILGAGHFAESGRTFYEVTELSKLRIPTISIVFGCSTAGGAYQPGIFSCIGGFLYFF